MRTFTTTWCDEHTKEEIPEGEVDAHDAYPRCTCSCGGQVFVSHNGRFADCRRCGSHWEQSYDGTLPNGGWIQRWGGE